MEVKILAAKVDQEVEKNLRRGADLEAPEVARVRPNFPSAEDFSGE